MENIVLNVFQAFNDTPWPDSTTLSENDFNKDVLPTILRSISFLSDIEIVEKKNFKNFIRNPVIPFFGWGATSRGNASQRPLDCMFQKYGVNFLVENKIIRGNEYECANGLVQTIGYLNLYDVSGAVLLIFDDGRAKHREWNEQEERLIRCLTAEYPLCVVRIREGKETRIYFYQRTTASD